MNGLNYRINKYKHRRVLIEQRITLTSGSSFWIVSLMLRLLNSWMSRFCLRNCMPSSSRLRRNSFESTPSFLYRILCVLDIVMAIGYGTSAENRQITIALIRVQDKNFCDSTGQKKHRARHTRHIRLSTDY